MRADSRQEKLETGDWVNGDWVKAVPGELRDLGAPLLFSPSRDGAGDDAPGEGTAAKMHLEMGFWVENVLF